MNNSEREQPWLQFAVLMGAVAILLLALLSGRGVRLTQTYTSDDGTLSFRYPEGWVAASQSGIFYATNNPELANATTLAGLASGETAIGFIPSTLEGATERFYALDRAESPVDALETIISQAPTDLGLNAPVALRVNGFNAAIVTGSTPQGDGLLIFVDTGTQGDGEFILVFGLTAQGELQRFESTAFAIASTFLYMP
jgi:hypothetical protein